MELKFEDKIGELDELLSRYRPKWQLSAISWMDYDDVCQIIRIHAHKKWHLWDQARPFKPWASMLISHQMMNLVRNLYSNYARPCLKCPHYAGGESCLLTKSGNQDEECAIFAKWRKKKEKTYNLKLPLPIEDGVFLGQTHIDDHFDYDSSEQKLHSRMLSLLSDKNKEIYTKLFIEGQSDEEVAKFFNFKPDSLKRKTPRYKQLANLKIKFQEMAAEVIQNYDIL
jgi:DNA-directed RNA polymerase specialized sigma24 family protein